MITQPMDVGKLFPIRKAKPIKAAFRREVMEYARSLGYDCCTEEKNGATNVIIGKPAEAKFLVTAHYDTPAAMPIPNLITPCNLLTFLGYQFLVIGLFVALAAAAGIGVGLLTRQPQLGSIAVMVVYWGLLLLMLLGPANKNNANDNTSGVVTVLEMARTLPENLRSRVCFVLFDLEEAGLVGSAAYRKLHKADTERQIVLNLDCVGDGDNLVMFPTKKLCRDLKLLNGLLECRGKWGSKALDVCHRGFRTYPSDQRHFPYGVGIAAFRKTKRGILYCDKIHTKKDTVLDQTNVNLLSANLISYITRFGGEEG